MPILRSKDSFSILHFFHSFLRARPQAIFERKPKCRGFTSVLRTLTGSEKVKKDLIINNKAPPKKSGRDYAIGKIKIMQDNLLVKFFTYL